MNYLHYIYLHHIFDQVYVCFKNLITFSVTVSW